MKAGGGGRAPAGGDSDAPVPVQALGPPKLRFLKFRLILECSLESINLG